MKIRTSKGGEFEADLVFVIDSDRSLLIRLTTETRPLSEVAADFEGLESVATEDGRSFEGYSDLWSVVRFSKHDTQIRLRQKEA